MSRLRMAVIGVGHLGKEHARILAGLPDVELVGVADTNAQQAQTIAQKCTTRAFIDFSPLLDQVDAAVIAVPTTYHHAIATAFLSRNIPVLVEKPLALDLKQATDLANLARAKGALLQVGHIERFNPAFEELQQHPVRPKFIDSERIGPFSGRSTDIGVVLDLMIHDIDLMLALVQAPVLRVEALGVTIFGRHEDIANARVTFKNGCVANLTAGRASVSVGRRMRVWAAEGYAGLDFASRRLTMIQPSEELRRHGLGQEQLDPENLAKLRSEVFGKHLQLQKLDRNSGDQLTRELEDFVRCVRTGSRPRVGGEEALQAMTLAADILRSLQSHSWEGLVNDCKGPLQIPDPLGPLFNSDSGGNAA